MTKKTKKTINIFSENINASIDVDEKAAIDVARGVLEYFLDTPEIFNSSCLVNQDFDIISFDILYCDSEKTHQISKEYRQKDYAADIITFSIFADGDEKFIFDGEINLGEIIISLEKVGANALEKGVSFANELYFLIAHGIMHLLGFDHQTNEDYNFIVESQANALQKVVGI